MVLYLCIFYRKRSHIHFTALYWEYIQRSSFSIIYYSQTYYKFIEINKYVCSVYTNTKTTLNIYSKAHYYNDVLSLVLCKLGN